MSQYNTIKIGSLHVPIIDEVQLTGRPTSNTLPSDVFDAVIARADTFTSGVLCGSGINYRPPTGSIATWPAMEGDVTAFEGDGGNLIVPNPTELGTEGMGTWQCVSCKFQHSGFEINLGTMNLTPGFTGHTQYDDVYLYNMVCVRYNYPSGDTIAERRYGYLIVIIQFHSRKPAQGEETITYDKTHGINLFFPRWNARYGWDVYYEEEVPPEDEEPFPPSDPQPYRPSGDDTSDVIPTPGPPPIGITQAGFINVYNPAINALVGLGTVIFPQVNLFTDVETAIESLCEVIMNSNLINYVIDCHVIPCTPIIGATKEVKVGFRDTGIYCPQVTSDYISITCGTLNIAEYFASFADYLATNSKLFLPFIGYVDMLPEYWQAGTIGVDYMFDVIDGSFMAYVKSTSSKSQLANSVIAQYSGNACTHLPLTGVNYSNMVSGIIGAAASVASGGGTASAVVGGAESVLNSFRQGGDMQQSNGYSSTASMMSIRTPYLVIERAAQSYPANYRHDKGYPSNVTANLNNVSGYTEIEDIDLSGIPLTQAELEELRGLLKEGVYF